MKKFIYRTTMITVALLMLAACAANRQKRESVTVTPAPSVLIADSTGYLDLDMLIHVPAHYFSSRSRLVILPVLMAADSVIDRYMPMVLDAPIYNKKIERRKVLDGYTDPFADIAVTVKRSGNSFEIPYRERIRVRETPDSTRLVGVVTTDGCGICSTLDTIELASVGHPAESPRIQEDTPELIWIEPEFRIQAKEIEGKGVALLQFLISRHDINLDMGNNRSELEAMVNTLAPILQDTLATLTSMDIYGMASADGSLEFNTTLSRNRAESARKWLTERMKLSQAVRDVITVGSRPEGWQPVLDAMIADGHPDSAKVKAILEKYSDCNDDIQERYIRRLPSWNRIKERYLQKDRKVEYAYTYTIRNFTTDDELLRMYGTRPDAFNEEELLRVAAIMPGDAQKKEVYLTLLKYFPHSKIAANNLGVIYLREGNIEDASRMIKLIKEDGDE